MNQRKSIVVLDEGHLLDGNLSWGEVASLGDLTVYSHTAECDLVGRAGRAHILLTNKTPISGVALDSLPGLEFIGVLATGHNVVDSSAARSHGIPVSNVPAYGTDSVAQHVFALILELCNRVGQHAEFVAKGGWPASREWCAPQGAITELSGLKLGLVGRGRIAKRVALIGRAFGMEVLMSSPSKPEGGGGLADLAKVIREADILSLHCQLTHENSGMVDSVFLASMKTGSFLINTARGALINEADLAMALENGVIAGAALDVLSTEPPPVDHPLCRLPNCIVTPHMAWVGPQARRRLLEVTAQNIRAFLEGNPVNVVNA